MKIGSVLFFILALGNFGCATHSNRNLARERQELMAADTAFSQMSEAKGANEAFYEFMAPNAMSLPAGEQPVRGREAIRDSLSNVKGLLKWTPKEADIASSRELGYTWGTFEYRAGDSLKDPIVRYGKYVTIWKKQTDGSWKAILDCGNQNPPP